MKLYYYFDFADEFEFTVLESEIKRLFGSAPDYDTDDYDEWLAEIEEYYESDARETYEHEMQLAKEAEKELRDDYQRSVL